MRSKKLLGFLKGNVVFLERENGRAPKSALKRFVLAAVLALSCATSLADEAADRRVVLQLLDPERRQAAFVEIVSWQKYLDAERIPYRVTADKEVVEVVVCPQTEGSPIYAVLTRSGHRKVITLVAGDGTLIPVYRGANLLKGELLDINGDGGLEVIDSVGAVVSIGDAEVALEELYVLPITPEQEYVLAVAFQRRVPIPDPKGPGAHFVPWPPGSIWSWELQEADPKGTYSIVLGPRDRESGAIDPRAVYSWSATEKRWIGPSGGADQPFLRVDGYYSRDYREQDRSSRERREYASAALARIFEGQVTDEAGRPLSMAHVRYRFAGVGESSDWSEKPYITASRGRFVVGHFEPGRSYEILVEKEDFDSATVAVGAGESPTDLRIELRRTPSMPSPNTAVQRTRLARR